MVIFCSILFWGCLSFLIPKKYIRMYMIVASVGLSSLYFFFRPPMAYDLYRHYEMLHILRKYDLLTAFSGKLNKYSDLIKSFQEGAPVYLFYAYMISLLHIDQLLPVITGIIIYTSVSGIIMMAVEDIGGDIEDWKISFCFFFLLAMLDFRTISGLRNMTTYALFAYVLYKDLVRKSNKLLCFMAYGTLAAIHSSIFVLIIVRLLVDLDRFIPVIVLSLVALLTLPFINIILNFAKNFSHIPILQALIVKIEIYGFGYGTKYNFYRGTIQLIFTVFFLLFYLYCKKNIQQSDQFQRYGRYLLIFIMYTLGAIQQYDIFVRGNILMYFMILPFLLLFLHYIIGKTPLEMFLPETSLIGFNELLLYLMIFIVIAISFKLYLPDYYRPMDSGMVFSIQQIGF